MEYCPAGAVKLGQKLCTKEGPVVYPKHELPDATKWGPEKWDEDYRDNNRINCYDTGTAPCKTACPAHIGIQGYLKLAAQEDTVTRSPDQEGKSVPGCLRTHL